MPRTLRLDANLLSDVQLAAEILREGGLVAFPTETVYGLGANALSAGAVAGIFQAKQRPSWDPLIVHVAALSDLDQIATSSGGSAERIGELARAFWPGPLTLLLPKRESVPDEVTSGRPLVGVRVPAHPAALALLRAVQLPLAAPSANRFGHTSPTTAGHVLDDLDGRIDAVLDGGPCRVGVESTVLDPQPTPMVIYRAGAVTRQMLQDQTRLSAHFYEAPPAALGDAEPASLPSPGVGLRHYAPSIPVQLTRGDQASLASAVKVTIDSGFRVGVLLPEGWSVDAGSKVLTEPWAAWDDPSALAARLFAALRTLETAAIDRILCPLPEPGDSSEALRDRLQKAARAS